MFTHSIRHLSLSTVTRAAAALVLAGTCCSTAMAEPKLVLTGMISEDISADGNKSVGYIFDYAIPGYVPFVFTRGAGFTQVPGGAFEGEPLRGSGDLTALTTGRPNTANWGNLNCFNGYCAFGDCVPGEPLPPVNPCQIPWLTHRWTAGTGWVSTGSVPRILDAASGRFFGGTRCDSSINTANDISGNGQVIVGGAWTSPLTNSVGDPSYGLCGDLVAFKYDSVAGVVSALAVQPGTTTSRADSVSSDGSVITGYDQGLINDPEFPFDGRRTCVWVNGVQTLLNDLSSEFGSSPVNGAGTAIAGSSSGAFCQANFGSPDLQLIKWNRQPNNSWTPVGLGRPVDFFDGVETKPLSGLAVLAVSDDGNTIVGSATYGFGFFGRVVRSFIWRPSVNGGVPIDFQTYVQQTWPSSPIAQAGIGITSIKGLSADGNTLLVSVSDTRNTCTNENVSLDTGNHGLLYLDGAAVAAEAPQIALSPRDYVSTQYTPFGVALNVSASGTFPMTYTWQREDPANPGQWLNLDEACAGFVYGAEWNYEGVNKNQLRIGQATCGNNRDGRYRVIVANSAGSVTSAPATVSFQQGTLINQQPENAAVCNGSATSFFAVAVSNSPELTEQWEIASSAAPTQFVSLVDGQNTLADGRVLQVFGSTGQYVGITPSIDGGAGSYILRCQFLSPCGNATSNSVTMTINFCACGRADIAGAGQSIGPDAQLTADDIIVFLNWFFAGDFRADVAGPGQSPEQDFEFTADDIIVFLNRFFAGC